MKILPMSQIVAGGSEDAPQAVSFDGETDYLSRSSDLVGNTDSKTFTFSCWVYGATLEDRVYNAGDDFTDYILIYRASTGKIKIQGTNMSGALVLNADSTSVVPLDTFSNVLISIDMDTQSNCSLCINDKVDALVFNTFTVGGALDFTQNAHFIATQNNFTRHLKGRFAHLYLDHTYRDLSIESNRRLFITEDLKPASGLASLNPILYLPLTDSDTAGTNLGTGGDFTVNGTLDTAGRGPNLWNCVASEFDGVDDYLSSSDIGVSSGGIFTFSCVFSHTATNSYSDLFSVRSTDGLYSTLIVSKYSSPTVTEIRIQSSDAAANADVASVQSRGGFATISLQIAIDTTTDTLLMVVDGVSKTITGKAISGIVFELTNTFLVCAQQQGATIYKMPFSIGELYFDTTYIDLATDNPFWDSDTNKPKPVRQVLEETGNNPLIAMPISADNPGLNLGTGGDFTLNGGGLVGARGGSEFWARSTQFEVSATNNLTSNASISDSKIVSFVLCAKHPDAGGDKIFGFERDAASYLDILFLKSYATSSTFDAYNGTTRVLHLNTKGFVAGEWYVLFISFDLSDPNKRYCSMNGDVSPASDWDEYVDLEISFSASENNYIGKGVFVGGQDFDGEIGLCYFTTDYIDFSQEENRNLFIDQLGYPKDLKPLIDNNDIPNPLIYLPFDDPDDLGANYGTGGDFTVNGTVVSGSDFSPS